MRIGETEVDRVYATISTSIAFRSQLDRLAIRTDHDVINGVSVAIAVFSLVTCDVIDHDIADCDAAAVVRHRGHKIRNRKRLLFVVGRPH
jgi:hypothetical protein